MTAAEQQKDAAPPAKAERTRKASAVWTRADLRKRRGPVERVLAWGVLVVGFVGSMAALSGGWLAIVTGQASMAGAGFGFLLQLVLTWIQWSYSDRLLLAWSARLADTALTAAGYGPLVIAALTAWLVGQGAAPDPANILGLATMPPAAVGAWGIIYLVALGIAWYPEARLVD